MRETFSLNMNKTSQIINQNQEKQSLTLASNTEPYNEVAVCLSALLYLFCAMLSCVR